MVIAMFAANHRCSGIALSGDHGGKDAAAVSLHGMALAHVSLRQRGAGVQTTSSRRGRIDDKKRIRAYDRSLQVRISHKVRLQAITVSLSLVPLSRR